jgi:hypothetical protein
MGLTQKLGTIPLAIFTDASNNIGIGGSPSGSYKFEVTGASRFWDGTQGFNIRAFTAGAGYGAIYSTGVTPSNTNFALVSNGASTYLNATNDAGMTIDNGTKGIFLVSSGNVGIGTTSPGGKLEIVGGVNTYQRITNTTHSISLDLSCGMTAAYVATPGNNPLVLGTNDTEKLRITSAGFLKASNTGNYSYPAANVFETVSSTTGDYINVFTNTSTNPYGTYIRYSGASPNGNLNEFLICTDTTNVKFIVLSSGTVQNRTGSYGTISDISLKENIVDATTKLSDLLQLKVRNFNFKGEELKQIGFIAQEMEEVFPNMIDVNKDGLKSVKTTVLIPMLVKAIQEQQDLINELSAKVSALENKS